MEQGKFPPRSPSINKGPHGNRTPNSPSLKDSGSKESHTLHDSLRDDSDPRFAKPGGTPTEGTPPTSLTPSSSVDSMGSLSGIVDKENEIEKPSVRNRAISSAEGDLFRSSSKILSSKELRFFTSNDVNNLIRIQFESSS